MLPRIRSLHPLRVARTALLALLFAAALPATAPAAPDAVALLERADGYRNFRGKPFAFDLGLTSIEPGESERSFRLRAEILDPHTSLVSYIGPATERGKALLMNGSNLWFYSPSSSKPIRITPQQRLLGEASNGDVASTDFSGDSTPVWLASESVDGVACQKLELTAKPGTLATYQKLHLWLRSDDARPVKADFFAPSGKLLKTAYYRRYEPVAAAGGKPQLTEIEIVSAAGEDKRTLMRYENFSLAPLAPERFSLGNLGKSR